jgi:hypothetical protein
MISSLINPGWINTIVLFDGKITSLISIPFTVEIIVRIIAKQYFFTYIFYSGRVGIGVRDD